MTAFFVTLKTGIQFSAAEPNATPVLTGQHFFIAGYAAGLHESRHQQTFADVSQATENTVQTPSEASRETPSLHFAHTVPCTLSSARGAAV